MMTVTEETTNAARPALRQRAERVCMLLFNPFQHDSRVLKEGTTLDRAGYDVRLVAVAAPGVPRRERRDGIRIIRVEGQPRTMAAVDVASARPRAMDGSRAGVRPRPVAAPPQSTRAGVIAGRPRAEELAGRAYGVDGLDAVRPQRPCARRARSRPTSFWLTTSTPFRSPPSRPAGWALGSSTTPMRCLPSCPCTAGSRAGAGWWSSGRCCRRWSRCG